MKLIYKTIFALAILILIICMTSCTTAKKATAYMYAHPAVNAPVCAIQFPVKDSIAKADTVTLVDTVTDVRIYSDTVRFNDTVRITTTLPGKVITKTNTVTQVVYRENTARVADLGNRLASANNSIEDLEKEIKELKAFKKSMAGKVHIPWWWLLIAGIGLTGWIYWRIKAGALRKVLNKLQ